MFPKMGNTTSALCAHSENKKKVKILIVDDEPDVAITLKTILEEEESSSNNKFEVDVLNDPILALSNFKAGKYDLLLLDIKMPKMDGFELCQQLQNIDDKVKMCFITAYDVYYRALRKMFSNNGS